MVGCCACHCICFCNHEIHTRHEGFLLGMTVEYFVEGRGGVNVLFSRKVWLKAEEGGANGGSEALKRGR